MQELASMQGQNASLQHHVATLNRELAHLQKEPRETLPPSESSVQQLVKLSQKEIERLQKSLSIEQQKYASLQDNLLRISAELEECRENAAESSTELKMVRNVIIMMHNIIVL